MHLLTLRTIFPKQDVILAQKANQEREGKRWREREGERERVGEGQREREGERGKER